jgi:hypothetical protein
MTAKVLLPALYAVHNAFLFDFAINNNNNNNNNHHHDPPQVIVAAAVPASVEPRALNVVVSFIISSVPLGSSQRGFAQTHQSNYPANSSCPIYHHFNLPPPFPNPKRNPSLVQSNFSTYYETALLRLPPAQHALAFACTASILPRRNDNWSSLNTWNSD